MSNIRGTVLGNYLTNSIVSQITPTTNDTYQDILNITKEGRLDEVVATAETTGANTFIKVTVDGSVLFEGCTQGYGAAWDTTSYTGLVKFLIHTAMAASSVRGGQFVLNHVDGSSNYGGLISATKTLPYTAAGKVCAVLYEPVYFKTSLRIEVKSTDKTKLVNYRIAYATYA